MNTVNHLLTDWSSILWGPYCMIPLLVLTGIFLTCRLSGVQITRFIHAFACLLGWYDDPDDQGEISHFQALSAALSATIGIGNIGGVATAIHLGGPGALFWMWITATVGMATKYASCTLSLKYRTVHDDGSVSGGPMYYIEKGLGPNWKPLAILFAICAAGAAFGIGNMVQANNAAAIMNDNFAIPEMATGITMAILIWIVIIGGIQRIAKVASKLVPVMALFYVLGCLMILYTHAGQIPEAIQSVFYHAFNKTSATGGFLGATVLFTLRWGVARGLFSNEAGLGSAPMAHAAAKTNEPAREGLVAMLGPFFDTIVICTLTALTLIVTGSWNTRYPNNVDLQSSVTVYEAEAHSSSTTETMKQSRRYTGTLQIHEGIPQKSIVLTHNDGTITPPDQSRINEYFDKHSSAPNAPIIYAPEQGRFNGTLQIKNGIVQKPGQNLSVLGKTLKTQVSLTREAFITGMRQVGNLGKWGGQFLSIAVVLFAFSTAITWSYYGDRCVEYLLGGWSVVIYRWVYVVLHLIGALVTIELVWNLADVLNGLMAIPNLIALILLSGTVVQITTDYFNRLFNLPKNESTS